MSSRCNKEGLGVVMSKNIESQFNVVSSEDVAAALLLTLHGEKLKNMTNKT